MEGRKFVMVNTKKTTPLERVISDNKEKKYKKNNSKISDISSGFDAETIYVGSKSRNTNALLRIYDKKKGTIVMKHNRHIAKEVDDWTRFEVQYSGRYAHILTQEIANCNDENELKDLLLNAILDKYMLFHTKSNRPHKITKLMLELLNEQDFRFSTPSPRDNSLAQSLDHLTKNSGLFSTLFKVDAIWGNGTSEELMEYLYEKYYSEFEPNKDHQHWVSNKKAYYQLKGKPWKGEES